MPFHIGCSEGWKLSSDWCAAGKRVVPGLSGFHNFSRQFINKFLMLLSMSSYQVNSLKYRWKAPSARSIWFVDFQWVFPNFLTFSGFHQSVNWVWSFKVPNVLLEFPCEDFVLLINQYRKRLGLPKQLAKLPLSQKFHPNLNSGLVFVLP